MSKKFKIISSYLDGTDFYNVTDMEEGDTTALLSLGYLDFLFSSGSFNGYYESITVDGIAQYLLSKYGDISESVYTIAWGIMNFLEGRFWLFNDYSDSSFKLVQYEVIEYKTCSPLKDVSFEDIKHLLG